MSVNPASKLSDLGSYITYFSEDGKRKIHVTKAAAFAAFEALDKQWQAAVKSAAEENIRDLSGESAIAVQMAEYIKELAEKSK